MNSVADLWYEHDVLRGKLVVLEDFLPSLVVAPFTIAHLLESLATCLRAHAEREKRLFDAVMHQQDAPSRTLIQHLSSEHDNHRTQLAILHGLLADGWLRSEAQIMTQASSLIQSLREHMAKEEEQLFPLIDQEPAREPEGVAVGVEVEEEEAVQGLA